MTPKQQEIADLCGKPFWDVVRELADAGLSFIEVCRKLDYSKSGLRNTMIRDGMSEIFEQVARPDVIGMVEQEYGKPFWDVVKGYADDGESMSATAIILGYSTPGAFVRLVRHHGHEKWFIRKVKTNGALSASKAKTKAKRINQLASSIVAGALNPNYKNIMLDGYVDTIAGHCRRIGVRDSTVRKRLAAGMSPKEAFSTLNYTSPPDNSNHPWRAAARKAAGLSV